MTEIVLNAKDWKSLADFYSSYCTATRAPKWFGKNFDAFADSLRGGICEITPTKLSFINVGRSRKLLGDKFWKSIEEICKDADVMFEILVH